MTCKPKIALGALALACAAAHAQPWMEVYAPPTNNAVVGLSAEGAFGASYAANQGGNLLLDSAAGTWTAIGGNSPASGFGGSLGISANGQTVVGNTTAANGFSQAGRYDVATGSWTALGSLGFNSTLVTNGLMEQSSAYAVSADGSTVVGRSFFNTTGTTASAYHPVVFRNGQVYDLNTAGTTQSGIALSVSADGNLVGGYDSNSSVGKLWQWNGSGYDEIAAPTINNASGTPATVQTAALSADGRYAAGGSVSGLATNYGDRFTPVVFSPATLWDTTTGTGKLIPFDHAIDTSLGSTDIDRNMKTHVAGVSNDGVVIGSFIINVGGTTALLQADAWIYDDRTGVSLSFDDYLAGLGLGLTPDQHVWNLYSMSADGQSIAGILFDSALGTSSAFVLHLAAVPEPGTYAMFAAGLAVMGSLARRRRRQA